MQNIAQFNTFSVVAYQGQIQTLQDARSLDLSLASHAKRIKCLYILHLCPHP